MTTDDTKAKRVIALLWLSCGTWGDMCAQDIELKEVQAIVADTLTPDLKRALDEKIKELGL